MSAREGSQWYLKLDNRDKVINIMKRLLIVLALALTLAAPVPSASAAVQSGDLTWSAAQSLDPPRGGFTSVSCVSATWCRAAAAHGSVWNWDGKRWARGRSFGNALGNTLTAMECVSTHFCVASLARTASGGSAPGIEMFDGHHWRTYSSDGIQAEDKNSFGDISCATPTFCMLVLTSSSEGYYRMWNGGTWTPKKRLSDVFFAGSVTCWAASATAQCPRSSGGHCLHRQSDGYRCCRSTARSFACMRWVPNVPSAERNGGIIPRMLEPISRTMAPHATATR